MFVWRADRILNEITRQMPVLKDALDRIGAAFGSPACRFTLESEWNNLKSETIDYGIMEHALDVAVLPIDGLEWSDVGSWDSLFDIVSSDKDGNRAVNSSHLAFDTHNSLVYSSRKKLVVTIGLNDLIIIDSGDALLVCRRDQAQQVRQVIEHLKKHNQEEYL
jgi:mannose-1-phosphate guanylyltransferase